VLMPSPSSAAPPSAAAVTAKCHRLLSAHPQALATLAYSLSPTSSANHAAVLSYASKRQTMPWDRTRPANAKYRDPEYARARKRLMAELERKGVGRCAEIICVMPTRIITPKMKLHLCHNPDGITLAGMGHARCNISAAAVEANRRQHNKRHAQPARRRSNIW
jgi:hypothetical protein